MSCQLKRIVQFKQAQRYASVKILNGNDEDITTTSFYSWSTDGVCWTSWVDINTYNNLGSAIETDYYLRILISDSLGKIYIGGMVDECYSVCLDTSNQFLINFCETTNLFNPYVGLDCALQLQQQISDSVVCMFGIPIYYFRVMPDRKTVDYTFKEYVMHNVESVKQIKLMIPDGTMPSSRPMFSDMDFDWEVDWDVELGKSQFARAFGDTAYPKNGDFIYIPMMKRMWSVNSAYDEKNEGLMWRSTTWKLGLVKYNEHTNIDTSDFDDMISQWTANTYESVFGELERNEQERESVVSQTALPNRAANTNLSDVYMEDAIRQAMTKQSINIIKKQFNNKSMIVAKNEYKFARPDSQIVYQKGICGDNGTLSFLVETPGSHEGEHTILAFGEVVVKLRNMTLVFGECEQELEPFNCYMVNLVWSRSNYTTEMYIYRYTHRKDVKTYMLRPEMYYFDFENPVCELLNKYNNDYSHKEPAICKLSGYPLYITNIKLYNISLDRETRIKESCKYTTTHEACVINDVARELDTGVGFSVK